MIYLIHGSYCLSIQQGNESLACDQITNMFVCECRPGFILDEDAISCLGTVIVAL